MEPRALNKIKYYNSRCSNIEWSGVGVMKVEGELESEDFKINVIDIILKDVGTAGYTEYDWGSTLAEYFEENEDKWPVMFFSIHSHHNMGVTPSGTDDKHLFDNIENFPFHLSVIVNNKLDFNARIATDMFITKISKRAADSSYKEINVNDSRIIIEYSLPVSILGSPEDFSAEFDAVVAEKKVREEAKRVAPFNEIPGYQRSIDFGKNNGKKVSKVSDYYNNLTPYSIFTVGFKKGNNIKEILNTLTNEDKIDDHLDAVEKYLTEKFDAGYEVLDPLEKLVNLMISLYDDMPQSNAVIAGLQSIGFLLESSLEEDEIPYVSGKNINALTDREYNDMVKRGLI